jgi:hypothetical protein
MSVSTAPLATNAAPPARGFPGLRCPMCGSDDGILYLDVGNLEEFHCTANECEFTIDDVRQLIGQWQRLLTWINAAPGQE